MQYESNIWLRVVLLVGTLMLALSLQLAGISNLVDGSQGDRDELKRRISYWATGCTFAYSVMMYLLGRWFTKDIFWRWGGGTKTWAITPSIFSITLVKDVGGIVGSMLGVSMVLIFAASVVLNFWLTNISTVSPFQVLGDNAAYNLSGIGNFNAPNEGPMFGSKNGEIFTTFVSQSTVGTLGKTHLSYYNGKYFWTPILKSNVPQTMLVENFTSFSVDFKCKQLDTSQFNVTRIPPVVNFSEYNITVPCGVFNIGNGRPWNGYWNMCNEGTSSNKNVTTYIVETIYDKFFGEPSWSWHENCVEPCNSNGYLYITKCTTVVEGWNTKAYVNSYNTTRAEILEATPMDDCCGGVNVYVHATLRGLLNYMSNTFENGRGNSPRGPLWEYFVGWTNGHNTTNSADWVVDRLTHLIASTMTDSTIAVTNYTVQGQMMLDTSIIQVNKTGVIAGILVQFLLVGIVIGLYLFRDEGDYHSDDVDHLLKNYTDDSREELMDL